MNIKKFSFFASAALIFAQSQQPAPQPSSVQIPIPQAGQTQPAATPAKPVELPPDTPVVTVEGKSYTVKQVKDMLSGLTPQQQQAFKMNPQMAINQLFLIDGLAKRAKEAKLDQESPYKEQLAAFERQFWAQAFVNDTNNRAFVPKPEEEEAYYEKNKGRWETASISVIQVNFSNTAPSDPTAKKYPTEAEALTKAQGLVKQIRAGGDFEKLAKETSDDKDSAANGGKFATIRKSDKFPPEILNAVFATKAGEVTEPIRQNGYFYILKVTERNVQPLKEVRDQVFNQVKQERFQVWLQEQNKRYQVKIERPEFFQ